MTGQFFDSLRAIQTVTTCFIAISVPTDSFSSLLSFVYLFTNPDYCILNRIYLVPDRNVHLEL